MKVFGNNNPVNDEIGSVPQALGQEPIAIEDFTGSGGDFVESVNTQTGVVVLDADDIDDAATTNKFVTAGDLSLISSALQPADVGTIASQDADAVAITGGSISGLADFSVDSLFLDNSDIFSADALSPVDVNIYAGDTTETGSSVAGAGVNITAGGGYKVGGPPSVGRGGTVTIKGGPQLASSGGGGGVLVQSGAGGGPTPSGAVTIATAYGNDVFSGTGTAGSAGAVVLRAGNGGTQSGGDSAGVAGGGGALILDSGQGGNTNNTGSSGAGTAGPLNISGGNGGNATAGTGDGGDGADVNISAGSGGTSVGGAAGADGIINLLSPVRLDAGNVPATATSPGNAGDIAWNGSFLYLCVASDTWVRAALSSW